MKIGKVKNSKSYFVTNNGVTTHMSYKNAQQLLYDNEKRQYDDYRQAGFLTNEEKIMELEERGIIL